MTDHGRKPMRWANDLTAILKVFAGDARFPVNIEQLARDFSAQRFPNERIVDVMGGSLGTFEGALYPVPERKAWAIIYNSDVTPGRRRFTIGHEFGHYLMHRSLLPYGIECGEEAVTFRGGDGLEEEADRFAVSLLMPLDDFRAHLSADTKPSLDQLSGMAERYGVSLISCILRWLEFTDRRSMIVVSRDGFILWATSSSRALKTGLFYRTRNRPPIEVPAESLIGRREFADDAREGFDHPAGMWFGEECREITLHSDKYDQSISILHFGSAIGWSQAGDEDQVEDTFDRFSGRTRERFE